MTRLIDDLILACYEAELARDDVPQQACQSLSDPCPTERHPATWTFSATCPSCGRVATKQVCDAARLAYLQARYVTEPACWHTAEPVEFGPIFEPIRRKP